MVRRSWRLDRVGPAVQLLDARPAGLDEPGLRALARAAGGEADDDGGHRSRSYRYPFALVARHHAAVGVDIERVEPCDCTFVTSICTPTELLAPPVTDRDAISLWSSKEALSKALGDAVDYDPRRLESPGAWPGGRAGRWRAAELPVGEAHVAWVCWAIAED
jgi:4'-phosphopantetheinyl transferase superfamily